MFQQNSNSSIIINGNISESFKLHRGCRQGDPISPYIFILCTEFLTLALKNSKLEGINLNNKEHKASQYADDTSVFLKASEGNLKNCLETLDWFYHKSGLQINVTKTKAIKIGPIRETDRRFCRKNNLDCVSKFTALGIDNDVKNLHHITATNIENKLESIKKLVQNWIHRNITPVGRVCVAKSLLISKITHVLQALPTPPKEYLLKIDKILIDFIWKNKRHEINKNTLCLEYDYGLKMMELSEFDMSLKLTWVRKAITDTFEWSSFADEHKIKRLVWTGERYHNELYQRGKNPFWRSVILAYKNWYSLLIKKSELEIDKQPLWGNPQMNIPFNESLYKNNILFVRVIFPLHGHLLTKQDLEIKTGIPIMLTTFFSLCKAIPRNWITSMETKPISYNVYIPPPILWLTKEKKGIQCIREIWQYNKQKKLPPGQEKWLTELNLEDLEDWKCLYKMPLKCKINARSLYFQFQVLHRTLITNRKLKQFGIKDSDMCEYCDEVTTIAHLLYDCPSAQKIWNETNALLINHYAQNFYIDKKNQYY